MLYLVTLFVFLVFSGRRSASARVSGLARDVRESSLTLKFFFSGVTQIWLHVTL